MKIKTYGVPELTEWHGKVKAGTIEVNVSFTGGTSSPSGAQPAYLVTKDPITQFVIENSKEFKNGFIILLMSQDIPGNHPRMAVVKPKQHTTPNRPAALKANEPKANETHIPETPQPAEETKTVDEVNNGLTKVEATCLQDAQAYLQEHFNIASYKVRSYDAAQQAALEHGVQFVGAKFSAVSDSEDANDEAAEVEE